MPFRHGFKIPLSWPPSHNSAVVSLDLQCSINFSVMSCDVMDAQKRIKQLMKERDWTDYRLAKESGLSHSTVTNMFNRNNAPTLPTLEAVCKAFGITLAQFFTEGTSPEMTEEQRILFAKWSTLTEKQKCLLLELMDTM